MSCILDPLKMLVVAGALQDCIMEETKDKKNDVEAYVYDMRNKLHDNLHEFVMEPESARFLAQLQETKDWFNEDETKGVYITKLEELKKQAGLIKQHYKEHAERRSIDSLPKHVDLVLPLSDIRKKSEMLDMLCRPILMKPKPAPPKPATPKTSASPAPA
ncbi:heat shock 70 kDa protein 15-like protein [Tanacetum coccineum]|uniref:Heat shock 70 kDa protein 15-like protein n=1 Tax=Tanacetum coccineum TaxID=301880 RepID=A0ABQ4ZET4_9ASTR